MRILKTLAIPILPVSPMFRCSDWSGKQTVDDGLQDPSDTVDNGGESIADGTEKGFDLQRVRKNAGGAGRGKLRKKQRHP